MFSKFRNLFALFVAIAGFALLAYAIWWWQYKDLRTFADSEWKNQAIKFQGDELRTKLTESLSSHISPGKINLINFIQPGCVCNKFNIQHVRELTNAFGEDIHLITLIPKNNSPDEVSSELANVISSSLVSDLIPAAPAAAVIDNTNELLYFGPYSTGVLCGEGDNLVEGRLRKLLKGEKIEKWLNTRGYGCFCDWK